MKGTENAEATQLSIRAFQSLKQRITDPTQCVSDGVIVTIITLAAHSVSFLSVKSKQHITECSLVNR